MGTMKFSLAPILASSIYLFSLCLCKNIQHGGRQQTNAKDTQRALKDYLNTTEGSVEWQWEYINRLGPVLRTE